MTKAPSKSRWKKRGLKLGAWLAALACGGFLVAASGIVPIKASAGHWPITEWFLRFGMHRSFATHSLGVRAPASLDDRDQILKGATHYDFGCRSCHGSPGSRQPRVAQRMTPPAPALPPLIPKWKPEQLFSLVKHGVKFTGMPAWPAPQRDDEVWAMVAFLLKLPELDEAGYRRLVHGEPAPTAPIQTLAPTATPPNAPAAVNQTCVRCHGHDGLGRGSAAFPKLAGQRREYLHQALAAYARGNRHSGIMEPIAAGLTEDVIRELASYYAARNPPPPLAPPPATERAALELGRTLAHEGMPTRRVPACLECHDASGRRTKPEYPRLDGQPADYLQLQLELFKNKQRGGSPYAHLMEHVAARLEPEQMRAAALYFATRPSEERAP